ncbi:MAG TPA: ATP synthase subunit I, partial [Burkholderiaceae bacterium]
MNPNPTPLNTSAWGDEFQEQEVKALTREDAAALRERLPLLSPWTVVATQAVAGGLCALLAWALSTDGASMWSALYGAAAVVVPNALLARGMTRRIESPMAAALGFMVWE